jgi:hypothetical protein
MEDHHPKAKGAPLQPGGLAGHKAHKDPILARSLRRDGGQAPIVYEYYDPENLEWIDGFETGDAEVCNYSREGMCLSLKRPMQPNSPVLIRSKVSGHKPGLRIHEGHHAEVRWCIPRRPKSRTGYLVGVRFYDPPSTGDLTCSAEAVDDHSLP